METFDAGKALLTRQGRKMASWHVSSWHLRRGKLKRSIHIL